MTASTEYTQYVLEQLEPVLRVRTGRFFGGVGIFSGSVQFAMIMGNSLYFVVDDQTRAHYEEAQMSPFSYLTRTRRVQVRRYFELPEEVLTDPDQLRTWTHAAIEAAKKNKKAKPKKTTTRPRKRKAKK